MAERIGQSVIDTVTCIYGNRKERGRCFKAELFVITHKALSAGKGYNESCVQIGDQLFRNEQ